MAWLAAPLSILILLWLLARGGVRPAGWIVLDGVALLTGLMLDWPSPLLALLSAPLPLLILFAIPGWRRRFVGRPLMRYAASRLPPMSRTEREAIGAGTVWWEAELFGGAPDWRRLLETPPPALTDAERAFLEGPVDELCRMLDDWEIASVHRDLPPEAWAHLKRHRFFGMIIPEAYGGLGFSAQAHSEVIARLAARSGTAAVTAMVPNSLGPAELLLAYGTEAQRRHYLPRLATGEEIPCFALTGPRAGSDAGAMPDRGTVCRGEFGGEEVLGLRLTWEKRYITLAPVATVLGLAFRVFDPDHLLGGSEEPGITCALVPVDTPGVEIGRRHDPLGEAFQNGPTRGEDVFIPLTQVIGGREGVGRGWGMLMERLAVGRGISLPAMSAGVTRRIAWASGAYTRVRRQFRLPIARFEGVREPLGRIGGETYLVDAARRLGAAAVDLGERPAVVSAIAKYELTEAMRRVVNDAMDLHGGRGICLGPRNYLARFYQSAPIGITVEGANILTRSMIVFGQGAMRCHPFLFDEARAAERGDLAAFDTALAAHAAHLVRNAARALLFGLFERFTGAPAKGVEACYYRRLSRLSAAFALLADAVLLTLGGGVKRREHLAGHFADALGQMYLCSAALKRFADDGRPESDRPLLHWGCQRALHRVQESLDAVLLHLPVRPLAWLLRPVVFPLGRRLRQPSHRIGDAVAERLTEAGEARERLTAGSFRDGEGEPLARLARAFELALESGEIERRLRREGRVDPGGEPLEEWVAALRGDGVLDDAEAELLLASRRAAMEAVAVDEFAASGFAPRA